MLVRRPAPHRGFTLVEVMIAIAMIAILAAVALPSFTEAIRKGRRAEAVQLLTKVQLEQERWRSNNATYTAALTIPDGTHYSVQVTAANATSYTATATARSDSPQHNDTQCDPMGIRMNAGQILYSAGSGGTFGTTHPCWSQ